MKKWSYDQIWSSVHTVISIICSHVSFTAPVPRLLASEMVENVGFWKWVLISCCIVFASSAPLFSLQGGLSKTHKWSAARILPAVLYWILFCVRLLVGRFYRIVLVCLSSRLYDHMIVRGHIIIWSYDHIMSSVAILAQATSWLKWLACLFQSFANARRFFLLLFLP